MKTQTADVTYRDGTVDVARGTAKLIVHTGTVRVIAERAHFYSALRLTFKAVGPAYVTATVELPDGTLEAITDNRVSASPYAIGWR